MKIIKVLVLWIAVLSLFGCMHSVPTPTNPDQVNLNKNMALWQHSNLSSYTYTYKRNCFCPPEETILITVTNGRATAASYSPSGIVLPPEKLVGLMTVEKLFQVIQDAITGQADRLEVTYNATSGYPESIGTNYNEQATDGAVSYIVRDLH